MTGIIEGILLEQVLSKGGTDALVIGLVVYNILQSRENSAATKQVKKTLDGIEERVSEIRDDIRQIDSRVSHLEGLHDIQARGEA